MEFHESKCQDIFIDVKEDELEQRVEIAEQILNECALEKDVALREILDCAELRADYYKNVKQALGLSRKNMENIRDIVKNKIQ